MKEAPAERPAIDLDNFPDVYDYFAKQTVDPNLIPYVAAEAESEHDIRVIVEDGANEAIAGLIESGARFVVNINHIHEKDTTIATAGLARTAFNAILGRAFVFAKHEHFNTADKVKRAALDKLGLPIFHPKRFLDPAFRTKLVEATKRALALGVDRAVDDKRPVLLHGEGERNTTEDKNKVQKIRALLGMMALGIRKRGESAALLNVAVTYSDHETLENPIVVVGAPITNLPGSINKIGDIAQKDLQRLVHRGAEELKAA